MKYATGLLKKLFGVIEGRNIRFHSDGAYTDIRADNQGHVHVQSFEKVDHILARNAYLRGLPKERKTGDGSRLIGSIPLTLYHDLRKKGILSDKKLFRQWINDPSNAMWRTTEGKL